LTLFEVSFVLCDADIEEIAFINLITYPELQT